MQFYGPAANCDELGKLGYTLNGYYLVKKMQQEMQNHEGVIGVVYCLFQQPLKGPGKKGIFVECFFIFKSNSRNVQFYKLLVAIMAFKL